MTHHLNIFISIAIFLTGVFQFACNETRSPELARIDSLENKLTQIAKNLNVDDKIITARSKEMTENMTLIQMHYKEEFTQEMAQKMGRYRAINKVYTKYLGKQEKLDQELDVLHKQITGLRNSVEDNKMSRDEFKMHYATEKLAAEQLMEESSKFAKVLYEVELDYQRLAPYVDEIIRKLDVGFSDSMNVK